MITVIILTASLAALVSIALILGLFRNHKLRKQVERGELRELPDIKQVEDMECCGQHQTCEKESLLAAVSKQIEYYNDEELDAYRGMDGGNYTPEQVEQFREVLYTMQEEEVAGWVRSLQLRAVELPDELKDEVFLIVGERRR